jgi:hypothetical protein
MLKFPQERGEEALDFLAQNFDTPIVDSATAAKLCRAPQGTLRSRIYDGKMEVTREDRGARTLVSYTGRQLIFAMILERMSRWHIDMSAEGTFKIIAKLVEKIYENILQEPRHINAIAILSRHVIGEKDKKYVVDGFQFDALAPGVVLAICPEGNFIPEAFVETALLIPLGRLTLKLALETQIHLASQIQETMDEIVSFH